MDKDVQAKAIRKVMGSLNLTNNAVNRFIADAVLEYDTLQAEAERLRALVDAVYDRAEEEKFDEITDIIDAALEQGKEGIDG